MKYFCSMNIFSGTLLDWYAENKRDLPWRNTTDPYLIWISEIILQQTRVAQGYEYFLRFIKRFPDVVSLAAASEDEVMKYWQGLGYYSRARNLHAAAKSMKGTFPKTYAEVRALKGVGDYTAAAICSFAYDMPYAAVDGNVYRVLSRYFGIDVPIDSTEGKKTFTALAGEVLDKSRPADYNQAIMDFGAVQCTPQSPNCLFCPLSGSCRALSEGKVQQLPVKQHRTKTTNRYFNYIYVRMGAHTLIHKRTEDDIWKNLFELPLIETAESITKSSIRGYVIDEQTIFTYAGIVDEDYTDRRKYKIKFAFNGETNGSVTISCDNAEEIGFELNKDVTPSFRISSSMDDAKPYLEHRYVIINNVDYYFNYIPVEGTIIRYHVKGTLTLSRDINTQIPDEDQAIEW